MRSILPFLALGSTASAAFSCTGHPTTVSLQWSLGWKWIAPDGYGRPVVAVNGQWPPPSIDVCKGDRLVVEVENNLGNETSSIHFHGFYQIGANQMDGPAMATQCPIPPGSSFTYNFTVSPNVGTYWWHSHVPGQTADGLRGPFIVHDPNPPFHFDDELTVTVADWYHTQAPYLIDYYQSGENTVLTGGAEPIPSTGLFNDGRNVSVKVQPGKTYYVHVINPGNFVGTYFKVQGHNLTIVEVDGVYVDPYEVDLLYTSVAQRWGVLLTTHSSASQNFLIQCSVDTSMFDDVPDGYDPNFYGYLTYDASKPLPKQVPLPSNPDYLDETVLSTSSAFTADQVAEYDHVDHQIILNLNFTAINNQTRATLNGTTMVPQLVPSLYTVLSAGQNAWNPIVYGKNAIPFVIKHNDIVEVVINNYDTGPHPWHIHGLSFQVIQRNQEGEGYYPGGFLHASTPNPVRRDTILIYSGGYAAMRFKANNPGVHLMHCHIEWHIEAGLTATLIFAPDVVQQTIKIPQDHINSCKRQNIPTTGNAAGNSKNYLNLTGAPTQPPAHPMGALVDPSSLGTPSTHGEYFPSNRKHWAPWVPPAL
ncbi:multicopper oxidase [Nemania sp. FL0916]|nr:multicopper oxidase [Nemania sp. FL0916]